MSNIHNNLWLEDAEDNFHQALEERNWAQAEAVLTDMEYKGFGGNANYLAKELSNTKNADKLADMEEDAQQELAQVIAKDDAGDTTLGDIKNQTAHND